jgi:hypothetical protein
MLLDRECHRCNGTGEIARSVHYPMAYRGPGPVPDDARGVTAAKCDRCDGTGVEQIDLNEEADE